MNTQTEIKKPPAYIYLNGDIVPYDEGRIHVLTPCVKYGLLVFEGIRCYWDALHKGGYLFRIKEHAERLLQSASLSRFKHDYTVDDIVQANIMLLQALECRQDMHIRQMLFLGGDGALSTQSPVCMAVVALPRGRPKGAEGMRVSISSWARISDQSMPPQIKAAANYHNGRLGLIQAKMDGYDSTIFLNSQGMVSEGPAACIFIKRKGVVITPPVTQGVLESITRDTLMRLSDRELGLKVVETAVGRTDLYTADEAFFCGTGAEVSPIVSVDHHPVGDGRIGGYSSTLRSLYLNVVRGAVAKYSNWLTPV